jgi:hypothetical protein
MCFNRYLSAASFGLHLDTRSAPIERR